MSLTGRHTPPTSPTSAARHRDAPSGTGEPALIEVYRETVRPLYRFIAQRSGGSRQLIEDVLQEVYLRAIEVWQAGHPPREPLPWLKTLARNLLINFYRRHRPKLVDSSFLSQVIDGRQPAVTPPAVALIHWGLARLPRRHAGLVEVFHLEGRTVREIAAARGLTERAIEGRLRRARKALRRRLEPLLNRDGAES